MLLQGPGSASMATTDNLSPRFFVVSTLAGLQADTRQHLVRLLKLDDSSGQHIPSSIETDEMWGMRRLLCVGVRPDQL